MISLRGIGRKYRSTVALADVDLDLGPGVIGLLGPNGAGKTTLLRLLATSLAPTSGEMRLIAEPAGTHLRQVEQYTYVTYTGDGQADVDHLRGALRFQLNVALPGALMDAADAT